MLVAAGDAVEVDQPLLEIETDKANVEVPSPAAGTVIAVGVEAGATIAVGQLILSLELDGTAAEDPHPPPTPEPAPAPAGQAPPLQTPPTTGPVTAPTHATEPAPTPQPAAPASTPARPALAAPSVRKLAREIGVDIDTVTGSGASGRVSLKDVKAHARRAMTRLRSGTAATGSPALPDFSRYGPIERAPMRGLRRTVARRMSQAWQAVPHVTQHDQANIGEFEAVRRTLKQTSPELPLTLTAFTVAVVAAALKEFPPFNASLDVARDEIVYKRYINIGVAVDTERGLIVPLIKDADQKSLGALATEIAALATKCADHGRVAGGSRGRHVHHHQPRWVGRHRVHPDRQLPGGGHPGSVPVGTSAGVHQRPVRAQTDAAAVALV